MELENGSPPWAQHVSNLAERLGRELDDSERLGAIAERVASVARELGCTELVGASEAGRRIVLVASGLLRSTSMGASPGRVLIVDGLMATGSNVVIAAEALRRIGRSDIAIVAAVAEPVAAEAVTMELGARVVSLDAVA